MTSEPQFSHLHDVPIGCPPSGSEKSRILRSGTSVFLVDPGRYFKVILTGTKAIHQ